jgi:hypothetical protein
MTDVSEVKSCYYFTLVPSLAYSLTLEAPLPFQTSVDFQWVTRRYIPEDRTLQIYVISFPHHKHKPSVTYFTEMDTKL